MAFHVAKNPLKNLIKVRKTKLSLKILNFSQDFTREHYAKNNLKVLLMPTYSVAVQCSAYAERMEEKEGF